MLAVVTGGSGSGKSAYAERLVSEQETGKRYYIATMKPWDDECLLKIEKHRRMREQKQFVTIECFQDLHQAEIEEGAVVLLECMSNLTANEYYRNDCSRADVENRILRGVTHLQKKTKTLIIVTNEVFSDGGRYDDDTTAFMKLLGAVNQKLGRMADEVTEVVFGIPIKRKGGPQV